MRSGSIAFLMGIVSLQGFKELPELHGLLLLAFILPLTFFIRSSVLKLLNWAIMGFLWANFHAGMVLQPTLPGELEGKDIEIEGYIADIPVKKGRLTRFKFDIHHAQRDGRQLILPDRIRVNWYGKTPLLSVGDKWRMTVRLKRPHGFMNPGGFDYEKWLFSQQIGATGYVRTKALNQLLHSSWSDYPVQRFRQQLLRQIGQATAENPVSGIISALVLGYRDNITPQQWDIFRKTGTSHLVAISGLHIGFVAGLVFFLVRWGWARLGNMALLIAAPRAAAVMAMLCATAYAALAGWSLPTQRALIMVAVVMLAVISRRHVQVGHVFSLALLLVLLHDPMAVLNPGFWLSFIAVALILLALHGRKNSSTWWHSWFRIHWVIGLGLFPILLLFFQQGSLVSPLANFIAVPVVSIIVVPLSLVSMVAGGPDSMLGQPLLLLASLCLEYLTELLSVLSGLNYASWTGTAGSVSGLVLAIAGVLILLLSPVLTSRWIGVVMILPLLFYQGKKAEPGEVFFTLLDVGQGLAAVVETRNHVLVFDTGPRFSESFNTGSAVVAPFLRHRRRDYVDVLMVSHGDNDHIGGVAGLLDEINVKQIYSSAEDLLKSGQAMPCYRGKTWVWDEVHFEVLHPETEKLSTKENNQSCVLKVISQYGSILLPGDIEKEAEQQLVESYGQSLKVDILVAPHHGSKTSSTQSFIDASKPAFVLYAAGYRNRYRFPYNKVTQRYTAADATGYATFDTGSMSFEMTRKGIKQGPRMGRNELRRYWHYPVTD